MKDVLHYKGYMGSVRFSAEDEVFHGKIEGIDDLISFEGKSVVEIKKAFQEAVDDYLEFCKEIGKEPEKSYKGSFNVRIPAELHRKAIESASMMGVSLNQLVQKAIESTVNSSRLLKVRDGMAACRTKRETQSHRK
jgi:predicted HicB family RNase H-like nuclease